MAPRKLTRCRHLAPRSLSLCRRLAPVLLALALAGCASVPPTVEAPAPMNEVTMPKEFSDLTYRDLVRKYSLEDGDRVDYAAWKASERDMALLRQHIEQIALISPDSHPELFSSSIKERSYWINTYNALVLWNVLELWPLESVRDFRPSLSSRVIPGKGFFYDREVVVGGETTNLFKLEKEVLERQKDPRLHFALNCASESCPVLRPDEWTDEALDQAARDFVNDPVNVAVEDDTVQLNRIFKWYRRDFPREVAGYLVQYAEPELAEALRVADAEGYRVRYREYDWRLNTSGTGEHVADGAH